MENFRRPKNLSVRIICLLCLFGKSPLISAKISKHIRLQIFPGHLFSRHVQLKNPSDIRRRRDFYIFYFFFCRRVFFSSNFYFSIDRFGSIEFYITAALRCNFSEHLLFSARDFFGKTCREYHRETNAHYRRFRSIVI